MKKAMIIMLVLGIATPVLAWDGRHPDPWSFDRFDVRGFLFDDNIRNSYSDPNDCDCYPRFDVRHFVPRHNLYEPEYIIPQSDIPKFDRHEWDFLDDY